MFRRKPDFVDPGEGPRFADLEEAIRNKVADIPKPVFAPRNVEERRDQLDQLFMSFATRHDQARRAAEEYLEAHTALLEALAKEKAQVEEHLQNLDKIAAGMPQFGGKDEVKKPAVPSTGSPTNVSDTGSGKDPVPIKPIQGLSKPLPPDRR